MKPQLAEDAILDKVVFPCWVQPKIDGVRALHLTHQLTGRSLDPFQGFGITDYFSGPASQGLDGEMTLGQKPNCDQRLCSLTTGAIGKFKGVTEMADLHWWLFDYIDEVALTQALTYEQRYYRLQLKLRELAHPRLHLVPYQVCLNAEELATAIALYAQLGYEGTIIRNPRALYKEGRATKKNQELWRVKPWSDFEILVTGITEGRKNENEAKVNTLGRTERSSAQDGQVPNSQVGSIQGTILADFHDPITGKLLFSKGLEVTAGSGEMSVEEAKAYFANPSTILGHIARVKTMTHGVKSLPRFPTFQTLRSPQDIS